MPQRILITIIILIMFRPHGYAATVPNASISTFSPEQSSEEPESVWLRPYVSFETVDIENDKRIHNTGYGTNIGYDGKLIKLPKDYELIYTLFMGYTGSRQKNDKRTIFQNGAQSGISGTVFKKRMYTVFTINVGATNAESIAGFTRENFSMLNAAAAVKPGINLDFLDKRLCVQPGILFGYVFVNTFDYVNAENERVHTEPVRSIQIMPGVKVTGNLKNGIQSYFAVQTVWNMININAFNINDASIRELSVKPYVQYGGGVQKTWDGKHSGYIQTTVRNGGRNGVIFSFGYRRMI